MDKSCDSCGSSTVTITRFGDGSMCCGKCLRNGKKLGRASVDKYLAEKGLVACPRSEAHYVFSTNADGLLKQESIQLKPVEADSYKRHLQHRSPENTYFIMVLEP